MKSLLFQHDDLSRQQWNISCRDESITNVFTHQFPDSTVLLLLYSPFWARVYLQEASMRRSYWNDSFSLLHIWFHVNCNIVSKVSITNIWPNRTTCRQKAQRQIHQGLVQHQVAKPLYHHLQDQVHCSNICERLLSLNMVTWSFLSENTKLRC